MTSRPIGSGAARRSVVGHYEIKASLGQGGGGEVYRAWDPRLERDVALKILHEHFESDPERVRRFIAEARAASALNHPNIVTVYDVAVDGDTPYIVSELIDGRPLRDEILRGPIPLKRLLDLATQIADGLSAAHDAQITHRDLKPENIMVTRTGRVKILDFGLARESGFRPVTPETPATGAELQTQTQIGLVSGTVPYMSPEQARGLPSDFRSDQFSFGLVLFEMATGRRAFRRETSAETLHAVINDEADVSSIEARSPILLRWIIERCLAKEPGDRYSSTADLHRDLRTLRNRLNEVAADSAATVPGWRRRRSVMAAAGVALVGLGALGVYSLRPGEPAMPPLTFTPLAIETAYEGFPAWSPKNDTIAYVAEVDGILQLFTRELSSPESTQLTHGSADCKHPFWDPSGQRIYFVSLAHDKEGIWSIGATTGTPHLVVANATRGAISPDGHTLAFLRDEAQIDIVGTEALWISTPAGQAPWDEKTVEAAAKRPAGFGDERFIEGALAFSPDGTKLGLSVVSDPRDPSVWQFWTMQVADGTVTQHFKRWDDVGARISNFTWMPDSRRVVLGVAELSTAGSRLWMADTGNDRAWLLTQGTDNQSYPSAARDGRRVVFATDSVDYDLVAIPLDGSATRPLPGTNRIEADPDIHGSMLAYITNRRGQDEVWLRTLEGELRDRPVVQQPDFGADRTMMLSSPAISPDGRRIAFLRNGFAPRLPLRIWIANVAGGAVSTVSASNAIQGAPTWSPTGEWIAYAQWTDSHWSLFKARVGSAEAPVELRKDGVANAAPRWSPGAGDWITWETNRGLLLVSADGKQERPLSAPGTETSALFNSSWPNGAWLAHAWLPDASGIIGIKESLDRTLTLVLQPIGKPPRVVRNLGMPPPVNNPVRGIAVSADGRTVITSNAKLRGDLWVLEGLLATGSKKP